MFWRSKDSIKGKYYAFSGYKKSNKVCLVYLECTLQQDSYMAEVKMPKNGRDNKFKDKKEIKKVPLMFLDIKVLTEM